MKINERQLCILNNIKSKYLIRTVVPKINNWIDKDNEDIWIRLITQIIIIQKSEPGQKFEKRKDLHSEISYKNLSQLKSEYDAKFKINYALREVGTRMSSSKIEKCNKTNWIYNNLIILRDRYNNPCNFVKNLSLHISNGNEDYAIELLKGLRGIGNKSARDFLMEYGMVDNCIAIDSRIENFLYGLGVEVDKRYSSNGKVYKFIENFIINEICKKLNIKGIEFDRMIYQHNKNNNLVLGIGAKNL